MSATSVRQMLLKFRGDLSEVKEHFKGVENMWKQTNALFTNDRNRARQESKDAAEETIKLTQKQTAVQINITKAKQRALEAETRYEKDLAAAQLKRLATKSTEIRLQQQLLALKEKQHQLDNKPAGESGLKKLLESFSGAATGGGLLNTIVAGAAGGGAFAIFTVLSEKIGELVKSFAEMPTRAGELVESLEKASARAGVTTQQFQQLKLAAAATGLDVQTMGRSVMMMNLQLTRGGQGISKAEKEFKAFGVSLRDGNQQILPANEILKRVSDLFKDLPDGITKTRLAADLFSRRIGSQMIPLLNQGSEAIQGLYDRADQYSILVDEDLIKSQHQLNVETQALKMQWDQFTVAIGSGLLPMLVSVLSVMNDIATAMNQTMGVNTTRQFSEDIEAWARSKGMMTKSNLKTSQAGVSHMDEKAPEALKNEIYKQVFGDQAGGSFGFDATYREMYTALRNAGKETSTLSQIFATTFPDALEVSKKAAVGLDSRLQDNSKSVAKLNDLTLKYNETVAQFKEKQEEANISAQQSTLKIQYDQGLVSQEEFIAKSKDLDKQQHESKLKYLAEYQKIEIQKVQAAAEQQKTQLGGEILGEEDDKVAFAAEQQSKITLINQQTAEKIKIIEVQTKEKILSENQKFNKENQQLDIEGITSRQKATQIGLKDNLKAQQESIALQKELTTNQLSQDIISYDEFLAERKNQIKNEVALEKEAAKQEYEEGKKTPEALAQLNSKQREADAKGEKDLTAIIISEMKARADASQRRYTGFSGMNQGKLSAALTIPGAGGVDMANQARQGIMMAAQQYKDEQTVLLHSTIPLTTEWFKILDNIQKASAEIKKMKGEIDESKNSLVNSGSLLGMFGGLLSNVGVTRGGVGNISAAGSLLSQLGSREAAGKGNVFTDVKDLFSKDTFKDMSTGFEKLSKGLAGAVTAVGSFAAILGSSKGHIGDILGGAMGGAGLGKDIGSMFNKFGKMAGPIGEIAGAAFGGILSGIIGQKNNRTQDFINSVNKQMQDLQASIANGTTGLQAGIQQLQTLRSSVLAEEGHSKKKQKAALDQEAQAITNQIIQLQQQVNDLFVDLGNQLKVLNAPSQFQSLLSSLQDIFTQYKKFQGAARDAKDLAMANQYLADSLRNFAETEGTQLNQAEQQAIQDALHLNDLLVQRQELMTNEAQTEYDVMTQGVLINQRTAAQTKMFQIQQARNQFNLQMEKINQEISLTTYKVDSESKIFNMATTRIALEAQLLALQEAQTDKDMLKIQALQKVVEILSSGQSFTTIDQLLAALGLSTNSTPGYVPPSLDRGSIQDLLNELRNRNGASGWGRFTGYLNS